MSVIDQVISDNDRASFTPDYKESVFMIWYRAGKPSTLVLHGLVPNSDDGRKPSRMTLDKWLNGFKERADELDELVRNELDGRLVKEKIEMLNRHATIAKEIQDRALSYLRDPDNDIGASAAVRMLVEGVRIEKESRGIPRVLLKMAEMPDDELLREAERLILRSPISEMDVIDGNVNDEPETEE